MLEKYTELLSVVVSPAGFAKQEYPGAMIPDATPSQVQQMFPSSPSAFSPVRPSLTLIIANMSLVLEWEPSLSAVCE